MLLRAHAPHVRHRLHDQIPGFDVLWGLSYTRGLRHEDLRTDRVDHPIGDVILKLEDVEPVRGRNVCPQ